MGFVIFFLVFGFFGAIVSVIINKFNKEWYMKYLGPIGFMLLALIIYNSEPEGSLSSFLGDWFFWLFKFFGTLISTIVGLVTCIAIDIDNILYKDDE
jgi:hypothetical protein